MRVLLVNPPHEPPFIREGRCQSPQGWRKNSIPQMTIAHTAGVFDQAGHDIRVFDCIASGFDTETMLEELGTWVPELSLINTTTPTIASDLTFVRRLKEHYPDAATAVFGTHVTALHHEILDANPYLDIVIRREPEFTALQIPTVLHDGRVTGDLPGCTVRSDDGVKEFPDRPFEDNLDRLERPSWRYLPLDQYVHPVFDKPYLTVNTARGCRHRCVFCVAPMYYGRIVRHRTPESIVGEIKRNIDEFGVKHYWFYADDFTAEPEIVKQLCRKLIEARLDITWWSNTRVDKRDEEMFALMKDAGAVMLSIGGESGSQSVLKNMKKGAMTSFTHETVRILRNVGIDSVVYFVIGIPGETRESILETIEFAKTLNPDYVEFYPATPYPGTEFYDVVSENGSLIEDNWENFHYNHHVVETPGLSTDDISGLIKHAYSQFYFRPGYLPVLLRKMGRPHDFARLLKFGWGYMRRVFQ